MRTTSFLTLFLAALPAKAEIPCRSVVALSPALGQMVLEVLGVESAVRRLRGVSEYSPIPKGFPAVTVATAGRLDAERIFSLQSDCVLQSPGVLPAPEMERFSRLLGGPGRPRLIAVPLDHLAEIGAAYRRVGELVGESARGAELASDFETRLAVLRTEAVKRGRSHRVFIQLEEQPLVTLGGKSTFLSEALAIIGVESVFSSLKEAYPRVSVEAVVAADPDRIWIFGDTDDYKKFERMAGSWRARFRTLRAVKQERVTLIAARELTLPTRGVLTGIQRVVDDGLR